MTKSILGALALLLPLAAFPAEPDVLTLEEASALLRVDAEVVEALAEAGELPGRRLGGAWRFHRPSLLDWLTRGRGRAGSPPTPPAEAETYGEEREARTAEEVLLREQRIILEPGELTLELGLSYSRGDQQEILLQPVPGTGQLVPVPGRVEQDVFGSAWTLRYGLPRGFELIASVPYRHRTSTLRFDDPFEGGRTRTVDRDRDWELGSGTVELQRTLLREGPGRPEVIAGVQGVIPRRDDSWGVGAGVSLVKSFDPLILFASLDWLHRFPREFGEIAALDPEETVSVVLGYAFAVNDATSLSMSLLGLLTTRTEFDHFDAFAIEKVVLPSRESFRLRFGLTALVTPRLYVEPFLDFNLTGAGSDVTLGLNLPFTFSLPALRW